MHISMGLAASRSWQPDFRGKIGCRNLAEKVETLGHLYAGHELHVELIVMRLNSRQQNIPLTKAILKTVVISNQSFKFA